MEKSGTPPTQQWIGGSATMDWWIRNNGLVDPQQWIGGSATMDWWIRNNGLVDQQPDFLQEDLTLSKCFQRFFDDFVIGHMITKRLRYAKNKGDHSLTVGSGNEIISPNIVYAMIFPVDECIGKNKMMLSIWQSVMQ